MINYDIKKEMCTYTYSLLKHLGARVGPLQAGPPPSEFLHLLIRHSSAALAAQKDSTMGRIDTTLH